MCFLKFIVNYKIMNDFFFLREFCILRRFIPKDDIIHEILRNQLIKLTLTDPIVDYI
jgi:hypothetical protein